MTRNGLAYSGAKHIKCASPETDVHICLHPFKQGEERHPPGAQAFWNKDNCMPHAAIGSKENLDLTDGRWWEPQLTRDLVSFFNGTNNVGSSETFTRDRNVCTDLPLGNGDEKKPWMRDLVMPYADATFQEC